MPEMNADIPDFWTIKYGAADWRVFGVDITVQHLFLARGV
jgi:hypothetical protein